MKPELELVQMGRTKSIATTGRCFVGDFIGEFQPGHLALTGMHSDLGDRDARAASRLPCSIYPRTVCVIPCRSKSMDRLVIHRQRDTERPRLDRVEMDVVNASGRLSWQP